jgi:hypothetical protein
VQDEPYYMLVEAHAADLALEIQRQEVRRFVDVNFGEEIETPTLTVSKIQSEDVAAARADALEPEAGRLRLQRPETQNDVRERMHLPDLPEDYQPRRSKAAASPPPPPPPVPPEQKPPAEQQDG